MCPALLLLCVLRVLYVFHCAAVHCTVYKALLHCV